jgi:hypothetical protein
MRMIFPFPIFSSAPGTFRLIHKKHGKKLFVSMLAIAFPLAK